jgi:hypothetical protein
MAADLHWATADHLQKTTSGAGTCAKVQAVIAQPEAPHAPSFLPTLFEHYSCRAQPRRLTHPLPQAVLHPPHPPSLPLSLASSPHITNPHPHTPTLPPRHLLLCQVYLLSRMGNARGALALIIQRQGDIPAAIDFVEAQRDDELWEELITWALQQPATTGAACSEEGWGRGGRGQRTKGEGSGSIGCGASDGKQPTPSNTLQPVLSSNRLLHVCTPWHTHVDSWQPNPALPTSHAQASCWSTLAATSTHCVSSRSCHTAWSSISYGTGCVPSLQTSGRRPACGKAATPSSGRTATAS